MSKKRLLGDCALILALLILGVIVFLAIELSRSEGAKAVVTVNGECVAEYPLSDDGEYVLNGGTNILVISNKEAFIKEADCRDKLCVNHKKISMSGERIICLPNRVMIEILGQGDEIFSN